MKNNKYLHIKSNNIYHAFGMLQPGRHGDSGTYRYGFQGQEKDDELKGDGNSYTTDFRQYDPRIARWKTVDPLNFKYPDMSPYNAFGNNPISFNDVQGDSLSVVILKGLSTEDPVLKNRKYYVDSKIAANLEGFAKEAMKEFKNLSVNNVFRTQSSSEIQTSNTKAKDLSRHQGGFAIDFNGVKNLTKAQLKVLNAIAEKYGFNPLADQDSDLPHFDINPLKHGYKSLREAVEENISHYNAIQDGKSQPITINGKKPGLKDYEKNNIIRSINFKQKLIKGYMGIQKMNKTLGDKKSTDEVQGLINKLRGEINNLKEKL